MLPFFRYTKQDVALFAMKDAVSSLFFYQLFMMQPLFQLNMQCVVLANLIHMMSRPGLGYPGAQPRRHQLHLAPAPPCHTTMCSSSAGASERNGRNRNYYHLCPQAPPGLFHTPSSLMAFLLVLPVWAFHHSASFLSAWKQFMGLWRSDKQRWYAFTLN